jgi:hypothetical protein
MVGRLHIQQQTTEAAKRQLVAYRFLSGTIRDEAVFERGLSDEFRGYQRIWKSLTQGNSDSKLAPAFSIYQGETSRQGR